MYFMSYKIMILPNSARRHTRPNKILPSNIRCELWTNEIYNNLKGVLAAHSNFRVGIAAKADKLMLDYFIYQDKEQKDEMSDLLLEIWRRIMEEVESMLVNDNKSQIMSKMCEIMFSIMTRYEWDLIHIKHWVYNDEYQPMTTQGWNRKMQRYHKQFEHAVVKLCILYHTLELCKSCIYIYIHTYIYVYIELVYFYNNKKNKNKNKKIQMKRKVLEWIDEEKELDAGRCQFAVNVLGLACMKIHPLHKQIMTQILKEWERQVSLAKLERYNFLIQYFSEDGKAPVSWQQDFELESAHGQERIHTLELFFSQENPSCFMDAWKCFASDNIDVCLLIGCIPLFVCLFVCKKKKQTKRHTFYK
ncbi:hypothetical protein RFI_08110 [Reticulomyxa filosa]|uniref:Uncharacterized protein n=1 Tax=Reticulomyxa filosa TaxID=46433 RepID=X6NTE0_RETFI|nr:hypothetical protein RFI_08110 [Reticulomyxa filosa]|eukprot:ETO29014.1 hypothetical protein RFI_08110 [Reticulomyxa filosa]